MPNKSVDFVLLVVFLPKGIGLMNLLNNLDGGDWIVVYIYVYIYMNLENIC